MSTMLVITLSIELNKLNTFLQKYECMEHREDRKRRLISYHTVGVEGDVKMSHETG